MNIRCIKQVVDQEDGETVYFLENVQYEASGEDGRYLYAVDEQGDGHLVSEDKDGNWVWESDNWFYEHFRII